MLFKPFGRMECVAIRGAIETWFELSPFGLSVARWDGPHRRKGEYETGERLLRLPREMTA
jgi:hypothetical protein